VTFAFQHVSHSYDVGDYVASGGYIGTKHSLENHIHIGIIDGNTVIDRLKQQKPVLLA